MESTLVIKVKYGETLRRFNARVNEDGQLDLDMRGLTAKILGLFNFPLDADLTLTYVDEDEDVVTLVDDNDLHDVMTQRLKFLRVNVHLNSDKFGKDDAESTGSSTPVRSPHVQNQLPNINDAVADVLVSIPEPVRQAISKLSLDLASKAASSNSVGAGLVECISKLGQSVLNPPQLSQVGASTSSQSRAKENPMASAAPAVSSATKDQTSMEKLDNAARKPVAASVDLNMDPSTTENFPPTLSGDDRKETQKQNAVHPSKKSAGLCVSSSLNGSARPFGFNNECPFSYMPTANDSTTPPFTLPRINPFRRGSVHNDSTFGMFHRGVQCDGCGVHPITGPRYKSKVIDDYDLCSICFAQMGNEADYIKMDRPVSYRHLRSLKNYWHAHPPLSTAIRHCGMKPARPNKLDSRFISDVNVLDGTMMAASTHFTKIWRMRNSGSVSWPQGARLVWIGGDRFSHEELVELEIPADGIPVDGELDVAVDFTSPELPGRYISYWRMASPSGTKFGQRVWVLIQVDASKKDTNSDGGFNLNLPPECSSTRPQIIDVNVQPAMDSGLLEPGYSTSVSVLEKPVVDAKQSEKDQEINFPINDTLLVGGGVAWPAPSQGTSSVSYPIVDLSEALQVTDNGTSSENVNGKETVENSLLKELEEMGFKQVDLNKQILRLNKYNLEQSVDDLCGVSEWDPILDELQEMGFCDEEKNKKLLKKNNGSIKRVVMDLVSDEKF